MSQLETPVLSANEMAEFAMRPTHMREYRLLLLAHIQAVNGAAYADDVRSKMNLIINSRKSKRKAA